MPDPLSPALRLTWDAYFRAETLKGAAFELGISYVTVSRRLSLIRSILDVRTNVQAADALARNAKNAA